MKRGMAQFGRAPGLGPGGRRFESCCSDHLKFEGSESFLFLNLYHKQRGIAQFGRALGSGPRGRRFESCCSDHRS